MNPALLPLLPQLLTLIGTLAGAIVGALAGFRRSKVDLRIAEITIRTQREIAENQHKIQIAIDRDRQNRQKIEEAYGHLTGWLYEIEFTSEQIYSGLAFGDDEHCIKCMRLADDFTFETIREPKYAAATRYLWSDSVRELLREMRKPSERFSVAAFAAIRHRLSPEGMRKYFGDERAEEMQRMDEVIKVNRDMADLKNAADTANSRAQIRSILRKIQDQVRQEMLSAQVD